MDVARISFLCSAIMFSAIASAQDPAEFSLPPDIQEKLVVHAKTERPLRSLASYVAVLQIDNKGNFGKEELVDARRDLVRLDNGLTGTVGSSAFRNGKAQGGSQELSLCGFIAVLTESASTTDTSTTTTVPIDKRFVSFGFRSSVDFSRRFRVVSLEASVPSVCNPAPGTEFTYKTETEYTLKTVGKFLGTRTTTGRRTDTGTCKVSKDVEPAAKINPALQGDAVIVDCETETGAGRKDSSKRAFLRDASYYLTIEETLGGVQRTSYQYPEVSYRKADETH